VPFRVVLYSCGGCTFIVANNYGFYDDVIARIVSLEESEDHIEYSPDGKSETFYLQKIDALVLNGDLKGEHISLENVRSESNVYDTCFGVGDELFIETGAEKYEITDVKRDVWIAAVVLAFFGVLIFVGRSKGFFSFLGLTVNILLLWIGLTLYLDGVNLLLVCTVCAVVFSLISIVLIGGFSRMTLMSLTATLIGTLAAFGVSCAVIYGLDFNGLYVEGLEFLIISTDYRITFMSQILIGSLGAIMDIAVSVSSAMCELKRRDPYISRRALLRSAREIGRDVTGTMANVLLFTYLCGSLPLLCVIVSNGVPLVKYVLSNCSLELARFLCGSIGIVLCVPISSLVCALFLVRSRKAGEER